MVSLLCCSLFDSGDFFLRRRWTFSLFGVGAFSRSLGWLAGGFLLWRQAAAKAAHAPQFGTGLWSQRNLCLPCVCRVVSPAFGVSKSTFVMPTHFQLRARSTRVEAARWVFCQAEPALQGSTPGGPAKARLDPPGRAARAVPAPPTHPTPTGHPGCLYGYLYPDGTTL